MASPQTNPLARRCSGYPAHFSPSEREASIGCAARRPLQPLQGWRDGWGEEGREGGREGEGVRERSHGPKHRSAGGGFRLTVHLVDEHVHHSLQVPMPSNGSAHGVEGGTLRPQVAGHSPPTLDTCSETPVHKT